MKTKDAIEWFGSVTELAATLHCSPAAISQWGEFPPGKRQLQIARLSDLKTEPGVWEELLGPDGVELLHEIHGYKKGAKKGRK